MCFKLLSSFESQVTNRKKVFIRILAFPKMLRFFKNCGHLSKATACYLVSFPILTTCINLTEEKCFGQRLSVTRVGIKNFQFQSILNCRQEKVL